MQYPQQHSTGIIKRTSAQEQQREYLGQSDDLLKAFLLRRKSTPNTYTAYYTAITHFFGTDKINVQTVLGVSDEMINRYFDTLEVGRNPEKMRPASASTKAQRMSAIRGFYTWLKKKKLISADENPFDGDVKEMKVNRGEASVVFLSKDDVRAMLDACDNTRDALMVKMLVYMGLRRSELASVRCEHFKMNGAYHVLTLPETKGGENQTVKVPAHLIADIEAHKAEYGIGSGPLFLCHSNRSLGKQLSTNGVYLVIKKLVQRAGLESSVAVHTLRHTSAVLMLDGGADIRKVKTVLRHRSLQTTTIYTHQQDKLADSGVDYIRI